MLFFLAITVLEFLQHPELFIWAKGLGATVAIVTAAIALWKKVIKPFFFFVKDFVHCATVLKDSIPQLEQFNEILPVLNTIASEFKNNHGSSLRDRIDSIETLAKNSHVLTENSNQVVHAIAHRVTKLEKKLEYVNNPKDLLQIDTEKASIFVS